MERYLIKITTLLTTGMLISLFLAVLNLYASSIDTVPAAALLGCLVAGFFLGSVINIGDKKEQKDKLAKKPKKSIFQKTKTAKVNPTLEKTAISEQDDIALEETEDDVMAAELEEFFGDDYEEYSEEFTFENEMETVK